MKRLWTAVGILCLLADRRVGNAQVNLDQPVSVGVGDHVYRSSADPNVVYAFPLYLEVIDQPRIETDRHYVTAHFTASVPATSLESIAKIINTGDAAQKSVRVLRGLNASVVPKSATDVPPDYQAELIPAGDPGSLAEATSYSLRLRKRRGSEALLKELVQTSSARHVGTIEYQFNAIQGGNPFLGKTAVGVFVGKLHVAAVSGSRPQSYVLASVNRILMPMAAHIGDTTENSSPESSAVSSIQAPSTGVLILIDHDTKCWDTPTPGVICLRSK
jgi:hypothetical protein